MSNSPLWHMSNSSTTDLLHGKEGAASSSRQAREVMGLGEYQVFSMTVMQISSTFCSM